MRSQEPDDDGRDDQHMDGVEPGDDHAATGEVAPEEEERQVAAHHGDRLDDGECDPDAGPRHQVVRQRVSQEAVQDAQDEHEDADDPVELTGLAEGAGEEDPGHMHGDRPEEDVGSPVMGLAHQESRPDVEREPDGRAVGLRDVLSAQRYVAPVVHDLVGRRDVVEGEEHAGPEQDDEGVEGDLSEHERPVVGEDLVQETPAALGESESVVEPVDGLIDHGRSQNPGPTA